MSDGASAGLDKWLGCILGGAIGDALGMPAEFSPRTVSRTAILFGLPPGRVPVSHPLEKLPPGSYTDDTFIVLAHLRVLAKGLSTSGESRVRSPKDFVRHSLAGWVEGRIGDDDQDWRMVVENELPVGTASDEYYRRRPGSTWRIAGFYAQDAQALTRDGPVENHSASCGPLTRLPVFFLERKALTLTPRVTTNDIEACVRQTHQNPRVLLASSILGGLLELCWANNRLTFGDIDGAVTDGASSSHNAFGVPSDDVEAFFQQWRRLKAFLKHGDIGYALGFGGTSDAWDVLLTTVAILSITKGEFEDTAAIVEHLGGDADSIGCLACSLAGLLQGTGAIPKETKRRLDVAGQPGSEHIERLVKAAHAQISEERADPVSTPKTAGEDILDTEATHLAQQLGLDESEPSTPGFSLEVEADHFVRHGSIITHDRFSCSLLRLLKKIDRNDSVIVSDSGIIRICPEAIRHHPGCIATFLRQEMTRPTISGGWEAKRQKVISAIEQRLKEEPSENEAWRLANQLVLVGTPDVVDVLLSSKDQRAFGDALQWKLHCHDVLTVVSRLRDPVGVPEHLYRNASFILSRHDVDPAGLGLVANRFRKSVGSNGGLGSDAHSAPEDLGKLDVHHPTWAEITWNARQGGVFVGSVFGGKFAAAGPLKWAGSEVCWPGNAQAGHPLPASQLSMARQCEDNELLGLSVMPRRNTVLVAGKVGEDIIRFITRDSSLPPSLDFQSLLHATHGLNKTWAHACRLASPIPPDILFRAVSLALEMVLARGEHGCTIAILSDQTATTRLLGANEDPERKSEVLFQTRPSFALETEADLQSCCDMLEVDGAVIALSQDDTVFGYGVTLSFSEGVQLAQPVADWLRHTSRGKRHESAAKFAADLEGKGVAVVGSQRGDVTLFAADSIVHFLPTA